MVELFVLIYIRPMLCVCIWLYSFGSKKCHNELIKTTLHTFRFCNSSDNTVIKHFYITNKYVAHELSSLFIFYSRWLNAPCESQSFAETKGCVDQFGINNGSPTFIHNDPCR